MNSKLPKDPIYDHDFRKSWKGMLLSACLSVCLYVCYTFLNVLMVHAGYFKCHIFHLQKVISFVNIKIFE